MDLLYCKNNLNIYKKAFKSNANRPLSDSPCNTFECVQDGGSPIVRSKLNRLEHVLGAKVGTLHTGGGRGFSAGPVGCKARALYREKTDIHD